MIVMPAGATGWFFHCLARETGKLGHLYSPRNQRGPWPWLPYALDNGAFSCWNPADNSWNQDKWVQTERAWRELLFWAQATPQKAQWAIVPDLPGNREETLCRWVRYSRLIEEARIPLAIAVQDGMSGADVRNLNPSPSVICVGGTTEWKWATVEMWAKEFPRVHLLRCNAPWKLEYLQSLGIESTDGTGWNRGNRMQIEGIERFCRGAHEQDHLAANAARMQGNKESAPSGAWTTRAGGFRMTAYTRCNQSPCRCAPDLFAAVPMCRRGSSMWLNHAWDWASGTCKNCGLKMPMVTSKPAARKPRS